MDSGAGREPWKDVAGLNEAGYKGVVEGGLRNWVWKVGSACWSAETMKPANGLLLMALGVPRAGLIGNVTEGATVPVATGVGEIKVAEEIGEVALLMVLP